MNVRRILFAALFAVACMTAQSPLAAQLIYTEGFDYADGDLSVVAAPDWAIHSGTPPTEIQVVDGEAVITAPGSPDHNRLFGFIAEPDDVLYYAVNFNVNLDDGIVNNDYFIHFKDGAFGFNARLATVAAADGANDYSLQIWASSGGDGMTDWDGDFSFGDQLTCVVRWDNGTGVATLWVDPVDENSTSISDDELPDAMRAVEAIGLRQDSTAGSIVTVDVLATGFDFDTVLAAVSGDDKGIVGDVNCDGVIDLLDVPAFVDAITNDFPDFKADINGDGSDDLLDVAGFVLLLTGG